MDELNPCPFCGKKASIFRDDDNVGVECSDCQAQMGIPYISYSWVNERNQGIIAWNKRVDQPQLKVKKLVWDNTKRSGAYSVYPSMGQGPKEFFMGYGSHIISWHDTEEDAISAAQEHREADVLGAINVY